MSTRSEPSRVTTNRVAQCVGEDLEDADCDTSTDVGQFSRSRRKRVDSTSSEEAHDAKKSCSQSSLGAQLLRSELSGYSLQEASVSGNAKAHFGDKYISHHYHKKDSRGTLAEGKSKLRKLYLEHLIESLPFSRMGARERNVAAASPTTCEWLFAHPDFNAWIDDSKMIEHNGFFWIKGKPGTGKSTIMKKAKVWVEEKWSDRVVLSYFFNARASHQLEKSTLGLWRTLVHQLLTIDVDSRSYFLDMFAPKIVQNPKDESISVEPWEEFELRNWVSQYICRGRECQPLLNLFIDALDEGHDDEVLTMVNFLEELACDAVLSGHGIRICLSSRHYPHIHIRHGLSLIVENQPGHAHDMDTYIRNHLRGNPSQELDKLRMQVRSQSQGIFLWVVLVVPLLNRAYSRGRGIAAMTEKLRELPKDLHDLFAAILSRDPDDIEEVTTLLQWVLYMFEPIKPEMLQHAIAQDNRSSTGSLDPQVDAEDLERYILNCSRGLVELVYGVDKSVYRTIQVVQFIHQSVRDFLMGSSQHARDAPNLLVQAAEICHANIAKTCLEYLNRLCAKGPLQPNILEQWVLAPYAAKYWYRHMKAGGSACSPELKNLASSFLRGSKTNLMWIQLYDVDSPTLLKTVETEKWGWQLGLSISSYDLREPLYYAVVTSLYHLMPKDFTLNVFNIDAIISKHGNPLQMASHRGDLQMVDALLQAGARPDATTNGETRSPLQIASSRGYFDIVEILLGAGAKVDACICPERCDHLALHQASRVGCERTVQMLIKAGANVNAHKPGGRTPLTIAAFEGWLKIVKLLLDAGADTSIVSSSGSALEIATSSEHTEIVDLLLEQENAEKIGTKEHLGSAFLAAASCGDLQTVRWMLERQVSVSHRTKALPGRETPLQAAVYQCQLNVVKLLLQADANIRPDEIRYALQSSRWSQGSPKRLALEDFLCEKDILSREDIVSLTAKR